MNNNPTVKSYDAATLLSAQGSVTIESKSVTNVSTDSTNGSGGVVAVSTVNSTDNLTVKNYAFVGRDPGSATIQGTKPTAQVDGSNITIKANGAVLIKAESFQETNVNSHTDSGGGLGGTDAESNTTINDYSAAVVGASSSITGQTVDVHATSGADNDGNSSAFFIAFFGFSKANTNLNLTSFDTALLDGTGSSHTSVSSLYGVDVRAFHQGEHNYDDWNQSSTCICIGPSLGSPSQSVSLNDTSAGNPGVTVTTGPRLIHGVNENISALDTPLFVYSPTPDARNNHLALFVQAESTNDIDGGGGTHAIDWNSDVIIYNGPSPLLIVGPDGHVAEAINISVDGTANPDTTFNTSPGPINVDNIVNHDVGDIYMQSDHGSIGNSMHEPTFTFRENYQTVYIENDSTNQLSLHNIEVINSTAKNTVSLQTPGASGVTSGMFFLIAQVITPTRATIESTNTTPTNMVFFGTVDNPIGDTEVSSTAGDILASTSDRTVSLIRSNILNITASNGSIGAAGFPYLNVALVLWDGATMKFTATASNDVNLDMQTLMRNAGLVDPSVSPNGPFGIEIGDIVAGDSINIRLQRTQYGTGSVNIPGVQVNSSANGTTGTYYTQFEPNITTPPYPPSFDPGGFGTGAHDAQSTYNFSLLDAGATGVNGSIDVFAANPAPPATRSTRINIFAGDATHYIEVHQLGNVNTDTNGFVNLFEKLDSLRAGTIESTDDDVTLTAHDSIFDAPVGSPNPPAASGDGQFGSCSPASSCPDVIGVNITMTAQNGSIGQDSNFLEIQSSVDRFGVLNAQAPGVIRITQTGQVVVETGGLPDLNVDTVTTCYGSSSTSCNDVSLATDAGSILDGHNLGAGGTTPNVFGNNVDLQALGGSVGKFSASGIQDFKVYSSVGPSCTRHVTLAYQDANYQNASAADRAVTAVCHLAAQADNSLYITETPGALAVTAPMDLLLALARNGDVRMTTTETGVDGTGVVGDHTNLNRTGAGNDIYLIHSGSTLVVENSPQIVPFGLVKAVSGNVRLNSADDIVTDPSSQILATVSSSDTHPGNGGDPNKPINQTGNIDIYGDASGVGTDPSPANGDGTVIVLRGTITPGSVAGLTRVFGNAEADTIIFDQTLLGGQTRAYGDNTPTVAGVLAAACGGGTQCDDTFIVNRLQSMVPLGQDEGVADTLTLDGQSGTNTYTIYTNGSQFGSNNYMINVLGSHAPADGGDTLNVYGYDTYTAGQPDNTGINVANNNQEFATNDIFLLRSVPFITNETAARPSIYEGAGQTAATAYEAFVAVLHASLNQVEAVNPDGSLANGGTTGTFGVERVNYDSAINGGVHVYGIGGNDYFAVDDNAAPTYLDGGSGDNSFQIGQIYGLRRNAGPVASPAPPPPTFNGSGNLAAENVFDVATVATTRGWLSRGISSPLVAQGGTGNNTFTVYSNHAVLHLEGDGGNNLFIVRGFALAETDTVGNLILPGGCVTISAPYCLPLPILTNGFSTAAETDVRTGAGNNQVEYNMDAPVSVDGGTGFNKLIILGTEFADHIVVTDHGIFGAGMYVTFRNIEVIEINALEGDDTIDVLSTPPGVAIRVIGGLGSNQINVAGDVNGNVYSQDINGTSSTINHDVLTSDALYKDLVIPGVSLSVAQASQGAVIVTEHAGGTTVYEDHPATGPIGTQIDSYNVRLAQMPTANVYVEVTAEPDILLNRTGSPQGDSILLATGNSPAPGTSTSNSDFYQHTIFDTNPLDVANRALVLVFTPANWQIPQLVDVGAINDQLNDGVRVYEVSHTVISADPFFDGALVRNVEVTKVDPGAPAILTTNIGNTNTPGIYSDGVANGSTTFTSATATFVSADAGQPIFEIDGLGKIPTGTTIATFVNATTVTLSAAAAAGAAIVFSLPSRVTPPASFSNGNASGTDFKSSTANFTLSDLGQPIVETDGGASLAANTVITAIISKSEVTISPSAPGGVGIGFVLPSRLAGFASYRDGATTGGTNTFTSGTAAFNAGDIGRPIVETDGGGHFAAGTVILAVSADSRTATLSSNTLGVGSFTKIAFALPARNASNIVLEGNSTTGIVDYYSVTLATQPSTAGGVTVTVTPADGYATLSSSDPRFSQVTAPLGAAAGVYAIAFGQSDYNIPVVIQLSASNLFAPFDPHNEFIGLTATAGSPEYINNPPAVPSVSANPMFFQIYSNREPNGIVQAPSGMVVTKCGDTACDFAGPGSSYVLRLTMAPTLDVKVALITDGQTDITPGGGISNTLIGNQTTTPLFNGNISISGATITRGAGSELGSFLTEGFQVGQLVTITGQSGNFTIQAVSDASMTFTTSLGAGPTTGVTISRVSNHGQYTGLIKYNDCAFMVAHGQLPGHADPRRRLQLARRRLPRGPDVPDQRHRAALQDPGAHGYDIDEGRRSRRHRGGPRPGLGRRERRQAALRRHWLHYSNPAAVGGAGRLHLRQLVRASGHPRPGRPLLQRCHRQRQPARIPEGAAPALGHQGPVVGRGRRPR